MECLYDGKSFKSTTWLSRHLNKNYNEDLITYLHKNRLCRVEKCSFCNNNAKPSKINYIDDMFILEYDKGYSCDTDICKNNISIEYLGSSYNPKTFEKIGSRSDYVSKKRRISIEESKKMKYSITAEVFKSNLEGFVEKYGKIEGKKKYNDRCDKIAYSNSLDFYKEKYGDVEGVERHKKYLEQLNTSLKSYIERYGEIEGKKKYNDRCDKIAYSNSLDFYKEKYGDVEGENLYFKNLKSFNDSKNSVINRVSKSSNKVKDILDKLSINYEDEMSIKIGESYKYVDWYLPSFNCIIEFYGDYWHCNPKIYESIYYHKICKMSAKDIWEKDEKRLNNIQTKMKCSIIVIWESYILSEEILLKILTDVKNKKVIKYL